jgi:hypothetical protein
MVGRKQKGKGPKKELFGSLLLALSGGIILKVFAKHAK